jgi:hypothetical protein
MQNLRFAVTRRLLILFLTGYVASAAADCGGAPGQGICTNVRITNLYIMANTADAYITVDGNISALPCTPDGGYLLLLPGASVNFKAVYGTLLAAHLTSRSVNVRVLAGPAPQLLCTIAYVVVPQ